MNRIASYQTTYLVCEKGSSFIVPAPSLKEGIRLLLMALKSTGTETLPVLMATMVKRSIFLNGSERVVSQVPVPIKKKLLDSIFSSL